MPDGRAIDSHAAKRHDLVDQIIAGAKLQGVALTEEFWTAVWLAENPIRFDERRTLIPNRADEEPGGAATPEGGESLNLASPPEPGRATHTRVRVYYNGRVLEGDVPAIRSKYTNETDMLTDAEVVKDAWDNGVRDPYIWSKLEDDDAW